jgi:hypothetical protein
LVAVFAGQTTLSRPARRNQISDSFTCRVARLQGLGHVLQLAREVVEGVRQRTRLLVAMSPHSAGSAAAMRVMSRKDWPTSCNVESGMSRNWAASADATICGRWLVTATARSCSAADMTSGSAPHCSASQRASRIASRDVVAFGVRTHARPTLLIDVMDPDALIALA